MILEYKTTENDEYKSIKAILQREFQISNRFLTKLKLHQKILINNQVAMVNDNPPCNSIITVSIDFEETDEITPQEGSLEILYEDDYFLAVNKPANIVVHPCSYHPNNTLANFVKAYLNNLKKIRPINRLDKGTSGVVLFAKNEYIQELFKNIDPKPQKEYIVIAYGKWKEKEGTISLPIARKPDSLIEREVNFEAGQESITHYKVLAESNYEAENISLLKVLLETGRTHQIRVHLSYLGHSLLGDTLYPKKNLIENTKVETQITDKLELERQALHAYRLQFIHPITKKEIEIIAPLPKDLKSIIDTNFNKEKDIFC